MSAFLCDSCSEVPQNGNEQPTATITFIQLFTLLNINTYLSCYQVGWIAISVHPVLCRVLLTFICLFVSGSTDCICFATVGTNDPVTSALHIIVGGSCGLTYHL